VPVRQLSTAADLAIYDQWVRGHPHGTLWQSVAWKRFQEALWRETRVYAEEEGGRIAASALIVIDKTAFGLSTWDIPRGPLRAGSGKREAGSPLDQILVDAKDNNAISLFLSPLEPLPASGFQLPASKRFEQPEATRLIDLTLSDEALLLEMKPKGRYNIRVAQKHGIEVTGSTDVDAFYALLQETAERDRYRIHPKQYYETFLHGLEGSFLLLAFESAAPQRGPIAGLLGVIWNGTGIYYYGASSYASRALMAPYLLQWEAMRRCREWGCRTYDLLGVAPPPRTSSVGLRPARCAGGQNRHPWAGVSAFKEKFGGSVLSYLPEQEIRLKPVTAALLGLKRRLIG